MSAFHPLGGSSSRPEAGGVGTVGTRPGLPGPGFDMSPGLTSGKHRASFPSSERACSPPSEGGGQREHRGAAASQPASSRPPPPSLHPLSAAFSQSQTTAGQPQEPLRWFHRAEGALQIKKQQPARQRQCFEAQEEESHRGGQIKGPLSTSGAGHTQKHLCAFKQELL